jgi:hypothetical protein
MSKENKGNLVAIENKLGITCVPTSIKTSTLTWNTSPPPSDN